MAISLHMMASVIWVGCSFFGVWILSPVLQQDFTAEQQSKLWAGVLTALYPWVWGSIILLLGTGFWMIFNGAEGFGQLSGYIGSMMEVGIGMILLLAHSFYAPFTRLKIDISHQEWSLAMRRVKHIRVLFFLILLMGIGNIYMGMTRQTIF